MILNGYVYTVNMVYWLSLQSSGELCIWVQSQFLLWNGSGASSSEEVQAQLTRPAHSRHADCASFGSPDLGKSSNTNSAVPSFQILPCTLVPCNTLLALSYKSTTVPDCPSLLIIPDSFKQKIQQINQLTKKTLHVSQPRRHKREQGGDQPLAGAQCSVSMICSKG